MAEQTKVSGSLVLKRLKMGKVVYLTLDSGEKPLFQGWNTSSNTAVPDFTQAANQPVITPRVTASDGSAVRIASGEWKYNDTPLTFGTPSADGWALNTTVIQNTLPAGALAYNASTQQLKVVKNVASASNTASDTITFTAHGEAGGSNYTVTGSTEMRIMSLGNSANTIIITLVDEEGNDRFLSSDTGDTVKLRATRMTDGTPSTAGVVKWFKEDGQTQIGTGDTATISRDDVQGEGFVYARWYSSDQSATALASDAFYIVDLTDEYDIVVSLTADSPAEWDGQTTMKVQGQLYRLSAGKRAALVDTGSTKNQWSHDFRSSSHNTDCNPGSDPDAGTEGTPLTGNPVNVGKDIWAKVKDYEDLVDFASYTIPASTTQP